jgi:hypothetical protein
MGMGRATAEGQRRDPFAVDEGKALEALRLCWGDVYDIRFQDGLWTAARKDAPWAEMEGCTPDELTAAMRADWAHEGVL